MIIKMTVHDNDFTYYIEEYLKNFWTNICPHLDMPDNDTAFEFEKARYITKNKLWDLLNPNDPKEPTKADITFITDCVKDGFLAYMKDSRDINYLHDNTVVTVQNSLTDKCRNGESVYWFQHGGAVVAQ